MEARGDVPNDLARNGELLLQRMVVEWFAAQNAGRPLEVFDVGANVGEWCGPLADVCETHSVVPRITAFEPVAATRAILRERLSHRIEQEWITLESRALSSQPGRATIHAPAPGAGTSSFHVDATHDAAIGETVDLTTIDRFLDEQTISEVDFIKCDAEGHDLDVLRGARVSLERGAVRLLQFEYNARWIFARSFLRDVFSLSAGGSQYLLARVLPEGLEVLPAWHPELERFFEANFALVREDVVAALPNVFRGGFGSANTYVRG